ncbi:MIP/aquaporin family protein [Latilactobacillus sakei]
MDNLIMVQALGELVGTFILVLLGDGVVAGVSLAKTKANGAWLDCNYVRLGVCRNARCLRISIYGPCSFEPAVTLAFAIIGKVSWSVVLPFIIAQMIGAFLGAVVVWIQYYPHWQATDDQSAILGTFATGPAIRSPFANLMSEIIGTFVLVFALLALTRGQFTEGLNPLVVGVIITAIGLSLGGTTGYAINPARDLGPRIAHAVLPIANKGDSDWQYSWIPVIGPFVGGILGALLFVLLP